jgi:dCTP deaminase
MRLSDRDLKKAIHDGKIAITPSVNMDTIQGVTVDLRLGSQFRVFSGNKIAYIDLGAPAAALQESLDCLMGSIVEVADHERFIIHPGELVLGVTLESIKINNEYVGWLDGRSSLARLGLMIHVTSHRIDPGWDGQVVLEFYNSGKVPLGLAPNMKICAINFEKLSSPAEFSYLDRASSKYKYQQGAVASKMTSDC